VSTFYATDAAGVVGALKVMFDSYSGIMPSTVSVDYPVTGNTLDPTTGTVTGAWGPIASTAPSVGADSGAFAMPAGACLRWHTGLIVRGHRGVGKTFIVPLGAGAYATDGTLLTGALTTLRGGAAYMAGLAGGIFVVWSRPVYVPVTHVLTHAGNYGPVLSSTVTDKVAILRSRRD